MIKNPSCFCPSTLISMFFGCVYIETIYLAYYTGLQQDLLISSKILCIHICRQSESVYCGKEEDGRSNKHTNSPWETTALLLC